MDTETLTLTDFLLARIAEARQAGRPRPPYPPNEEFHWDDEETYFRVARTLALHYADHPDYRDEWRP